MKIYAIEDTSGHDQGWELRYRAAYSDWERLRKVRRNTKAHAALTGEVEIVEAREYPDMHADLTDVTSDVERLGLA